MHYRQIYNINTFITLKYYLLLIVYNIVFNKVYNK
jgi:hypothetical protein